MSRELDARVASRMGLNVIGEAWAYPCPEGSGYWTPDGYEHRGGLESSMQPVYVDRCTCQLWEGDELAPKPKVLGHYFTCLQVVSFYSEDIAAARAMEDWIEANDKRSSYAQAIVAVFKDAGLCPAEDVWPLWAVWALLRATPEQRCRAFLAAMEAHNE